jgi:hypothetical protein
LQILKLRIPQATIMIGRRSDFESLMGFDRLDILRFILSEEEVRRILFIGLAHDGLTQQLRAFLSLWMGDAAGLAYEPSQIVIDRIARMSARGPLGFFVKHDAIEHYGAHSKRTIRKETEASNRSASSLAAQRRAAGAQKSAATPFRALNPAIERGAPKITPAASAQAGFPAPISTDSPSPKARLNVEAMTLQQRFAETLSRVPNYLTGEVKQQFAALLEPESLAFISAGLALWAVGHFFGPSEILDAALIIFAGIGIVFVGKLAIDAVGNIFSAIKIVSAAKTESDLDEAAKDIADFVAAVGVAALIAFVTHAVSKRVAGSSEKQAPTESEAEKSGRPSMSRERTPKLRQEENPDEKPDQGGNKSENAPTKTILKAPQINQKEPGAVIITEALWDEIAEGAIVKDWKTPPMKAGWPPMGKPDYASFKGEPEPIEIKGPKTLYRVIGSKNAADGAYWSEKAPPLTEGEWRSTNAVTNNMNGDGGYVTYELGEGETIPAWSGKIRAQLSADGVHALPGGESQLFLGRGVANAGDVVPTPWNK